MCPFHSPMVYMGPAWGCMRHSRDGSGGVGTGARTSDAHRSSSGSEALGERSPFYEPEVSRMRNSNSVGELCHTEGGVGCSQSGWLGRGEIGLDGGRAGALGVWLVARPDNIGVGSCPPSGSKMGTRGRQISSDDEDTHHDDSTKRVTTQPTNQSTAGHYVRPIPTFPTPNLATWR